MEVFLQFIGTDCPAPSERVSIQRPKLYITEGMPQTRELARLPENLLR